MPKKKRAKEAILNSKKTKRTKPLVLIIDDDANWRDALTTLLTPQCEVKTDPRAAGAAERATKLPRVPNLIILDTFFPDGDGEQVFTDIRAMPSLFEVPVLMLSDYNALNVEADAAWEGQLRFHATKPSTGATPAMQDLLRLIRAKL